jgi:hypothetical protein
MPAHGTFQAMELYHNRFRAMRKRGLCGAVLFGVRIETMSGVGALIIVGDPLH